MAAEESKHLCKTGKENFKRCSVNVIELNDSNELYPCTQNSASQVT